MNKTESLELRVKELEAENLKIATTAHGLQTYLMSVEDRLSEALEVLRADEADRLEEERPCRCCSTLPCIPKCTRKSRLSKLINSNKGE